jgi:hypothetical protein
MEWRGGRRVEVNYIGWIAIRQTHVIPTSPRFETYFTFLCKVELVSREIESFESA